MWICQYNSHLSMPIVFFVLLGTNNKRLSSQYTLKRIQRLTMDSEKIQTCLKGLARENDIAGRSFRAAKAKSVDNRVAGGHMATTGSVCPTAVGVGVLVEGLRLAPHHRLQSTCHITQNRWGLSLIHSISDSRSF